MKVTLRSRLPLGLILLAGTGLRLFRLGAESLWYDETVSVMLAGSPLRELLRHTASDIHPPGYYLLLRAWLLLSGYPTGHAAPAGNGLEFAAGFLSLAAGVLLIALVYVLARRVAARSAALPATALVAFSPFNLWYSQEVRMYTLGACLAAVVMYALFRATGIRHAGTRPETDPAGEGGRSASGLARRAGSESRPLWWAVYVLAAAAGMYTLYYFVFPLVVANLWLLARLVWTQANRRRDGRLSLRESGLVRLWPWLLANGAALVLYAPWIPVAWRQATDPPVPPWRTVPALFVALRESWTALSLGQSAPGWLWPALLLTLVVYAFGILALFRRAAGDRPGEPSGAWAPALLIAVPFGSLALILIASALTPLYNVRYVFTYSPAFYVVLGAGLAWLWSRRRALAGLVAFTWVAAAAVTGYTFWQVPAYQSDDLRAAVRYLESHWRPGDVVLVNAGYAYPALLTYWNGPLAWRGRLSDLKATLPAETQQAGDEAGAAGGAGQPGLILVTTGHVDSDPGLGWGDPRSDFFAMPAEDAARQLDVLFAHYSRVWQYRIYDTVNDPKATMRDLLAQKGQLFDDQVFSGEANLRIQGYLPRGQSAVVRPGQDGPVVTLGDNLRLNSQPLPTRVVAGQTLYPVVTWQTGSRLSAPLATSLRLVGPDGATWAQPPDELPLGPLFRADAWPVGQPVRQPLALSVPAGTPPGHYSVVLLVYDPATGRPWPGTPVSGEAPGGAGIILGHVEVEKPAIAQGERPVQAEFGPLALIEAGSPAVTLSPGDQVPVDLLWQPTRAPSEPLVVVIQLLDGQNRVAAGLEAQPLDGRYPTQDWASGEVVRDRHSLALPLDLPPGAYRLVVGVYRAADRQRLNTRSGLFGQSQFWVIKTLTVG